MNSSCLSIENFVILARFNSLACNRSHPFSFFFFLNDPAPTDLSPFPLPAPLPFPPAVSILGQICPGGSRGQARTRGSPCLPAPPRPSPPPHAYEGCPPLQVPFHLRPPVPQEALVGGARAGRARAPARQGLARFVRPGPPGG